jgi:hypothetical protein
MALIRSRLQGDPERWQAVLAAAALAGASPGALPT